MFWIAADLVLIVIYFVLTWQAGHAGQCRLAAQALIKIMRENQFLLGARRAAAPDRFPKGRRANDPARSIDPQIGPRVAFPGESRSFKEFVEASLCGKQEASTGAAGAWRKRTR